jgi:hypothetical protein
MAGIQVYLSHSYRPEDRSINIAVWQRLNAAGLVFAVDPPDPDGTRAMDVTFIERMMQRCGAFVAIVPDRSRNRGAAADADEPATDWSPYQSLECRLAMRVGKPRLIILESAMSLGPLPESERVLSFTRRKPNAHELSPDFDERLADLVAHAQVERPALMPKVGLLRWRRGHESWRALVDLMGEQFDADGNSNCEVIDLSDTTRDHALLGQARRFGIVVADLHPDVTPPHVIGLLHGAGVPLYRCCLQGPADVEADWSTALGLRPGTSPLHAPRLLHGYQVDPQMQPVRFWRAADTEGTARAIVETVRAYQRRERSLETKDSARDYFLGLRGNRVFISTPGSLAAFSEKLWERLDGDDVPAFHYMRSRMPGGAEWKPRLEQEIQDADLLLGLITADYWDRTECIDELELAVQRWERHEMMILLYRHTGKEPLPPFLGRYQANTLRDVDASHAQISADLRECFSSHARVATEEQVEQAAAIVARHLSVTQLPRLAGELKAHCGLDDDQVQQVLVRLEGAARPAHKLVRILVGAIHEEPYGGAAFARLCLNLRSLESDPAARAWLDGLFSQLRLLPKLHDLRHWIARLHRKEVVVRLRSAAPVDLLKLAARALGQVGDPLPLIRAADAEVASQLEVVDAAGALADPATRVRIDCTVDELGVPVEWATLPGLQAPLALARAVHRRVLKLAPLAQRAPLETHFGDNAGAPPRVLLFGAPSLRLPQVGAELSSLERSLRKRYADWGWPDDVLVRSVSGAAATGDALQRNVERSDFDVLHLAGHAGFDGDQPAFEVAGPDGTATFVHADELAGWVRHSSVRFVYLSCCEGAATPMTPERSAGWQKSLCKSLLEAGVAEVLAFFWPIEDTDAAVFTSHFYKTWLPRFDAPAALLSARLAVGAESPLWASSLLVRQSASTDG